MRRWGLVIALLSVFALVAASCGDDSGEGQADDSADATADGSDGDGDGEPGDGTATDGTTDATDDGDDALTDDAEGDGDDGDDGDDDSADDGTDTAEPTGDIRADFTASFVRDDPFSSLDEFCVAHDAAELADSDDGITAESITLVHLRSRLEQLGEIGFAIPVGDPALMFQVFADHVNAECGGVRGRTIDLELVEVDAFNPAEDIDALRNAACIEATEDKGGVIVMNSSGFQGSATLCITEEHDVAFITTQGNPDEYSERAQGRLVSFSATLGEILRYLSGYAIDQGLLEGKTIGVVAPDTPGQSEAVEESLVIPLRDAGYDVAVFDIIGCQGSTTCTQGIQESVTNLLDSGVDLLFPTLNVVSLPQYVGEMVTQGFEPGDIEFLNSDFNSQAGDLVASKVVAFGGAEAGALYDGAILVHTAETGAFRDPAYEVPAFDGMCNRTYAENGGVAHDPFDPVDSGPFGMVTNVCSQLRMALRAIYHAGDNPTRDEIFATLTDLGPVDVQAQLPASTAPGKASVADAVHALLFHYPCPFEGLGFGEENSCITPVENDVWIAAPR